MLMDSKLAVQKGKADAFVLINARTARQRCHQGVVPCDTHLEAALEGQRVVGVLRQVLIHAMVGLRRILCHVRHVFSEIENFLILAKLTCCNNCMKVGVRIV